MGTELEPLACDQSGQLKELVFHFRQLDASDTKHWPVVDRLRKVPALRIDVLSSLLPNTQEFLLSFQNIVELTFNHATPMKLPRLRTLHLTDSLQHRDIKQM